MNKILCNFVIGVPIGVLIVCWMLALGGVPTNYQMLGVGTVLMNLKYIDVDKGQGDKGCYF